MHQPTSSLASSKAALQRFRQLPRKEQLGSIIGCLLLIGPLAWLRHYIHQHDSYAPSMWWQGIFIVLAFAMMVWLQRFYLPLLGGVLLLSVSAGSPRYIGEFLHDKVASPTVMDVPISRVAAKPLAPRCDDYVELNLPHHFVGWLCARQDLKQWPEHQTINLPVTVSWFGVKVQQPVIWPQSTTLDHAALLRSWQFVRGNPIFSAFELSEQDGEREFYEWSAGLFAGQGHWRWLDGNRIEISANNDSPKVLQIISFSADILTLQLVGSSELSYFVPLVEGAAGGD